MAGRKFEMYQKHIDYLNSVVPELLEAEKTIDRIKGSYEWKRAYNYFSCLKSRGILRTKPTKENGYKLEMTEGFVCVEDLESIVSTEQMQQIKKLLHF